MSKPVRRAFFYIIDPGFAEALIAEGAKLVERDGQRLIHVEFANEILESRIAEPGELAVEAVK